MNSDYCGFDDEFWQFPENAKVQQIENKKMLLITGE